MSKNKSDQNAHEEQVFNDVLKLSMVSGGYKKKAALKVGGSINAGSECPDIVITRENGSIVGLEHFRIDHNIKHGRNAQSKSAELTSAMKADYEKLVPRLKVDSVSSEEMASLAANYVSLAKYHQSCDLLFCLSFCLTVRLCSVCVFVCQRNQVAVLVKAQPLPCAALPCPAVHLLVAEVAQAYKVASVGRYVRIADVRWC